MCIGVQCNSVRADGDNLFECSFKGAWGLLGQAVNQIQIDRFKPKTATRLHQLGDLLNRLNAVHSLLHTFVKVLNAKANAVKSRGSQKPKSLRRHSPWIDLDGALTPRRKLKSPLQSLHQCGELLVLQKGRRPPTQMKLGDLLASAKCIGVELDFSLKELKITQRLGVPLCNNFVTSAVVA